MTATPVFVVGSGRCGSTLISEMLNRHADVLSLSELFRVLGASAFSYGRISGAEFWRILSVPGPGLRFLFDRSQHAPASRYAFDETSRFTEADLPPILYVTLPHLVSGTREQEALFDEMAPVISAQKSQSIEAHYRDLFNWLTSKFQRRIWVERSGASLAYLPRLIERFPEAKFVHIYRDGRDVALSIAAHTNMRMYVQGWRRVDRFGFNALERPFVMGENPLYRWLEPLAFRWLDVEKMKSAPLPVAQAGRFWSELIRIGVDRLGQLPAERVMSLCYEDLLKTPSAQLGSLMQFVFPGEDHDDWIRLVKDMPVNKPGRLATLDEDEAAILRAACQPGLERLGYRI